MDTQSVNRNSGFSVVLRFRPKTRSDHPPSNETLRTTKGEKAQHSEFHGFLQVSSNPEVGKWHAEKHSQGRTVHSVSILDQKDALESLKVDFLSCKLELGEFLIRLFLPYSVQTPPPTEPETLDSCTRWVST